MAITLNAKQLIEGALQMIDGLGVGESLQAEDHEIGVQVLNLLLTDLQEDGVFPLNVTTEKIDLVSGTSTYNPTNDIVDILFAYARDGNDDYPIRIVDSKFFDSLRDKTDDSDIPQYLLFESLSTQQVTVWPEPNDSTIDLRLRIVTSTTEATQSNNTLDIGSPFFRALMFLLAADLGYRYGASMKRIEQLRIEGQRILEKKWSSTSHKDSSKFVGGAFD